MDTIKMRENLRPHRYHYKRVSMYWTIPTSFPASLWYTSLLYGALTTSLFLEPNFLSFESRFSVRWVPIIYLLYNTYMCTSWGISYSLSSNIIYKLNSNSNSLVLKLLDFKVNVDYTICLWFYLHHWIGKMQ